MKKSTLIIGLVFLLAVVFALGMPLWAAKNEDQKDVQVESEKSITPQQKKELPSTDRVQLPGPKINEFSCERITGGYHINLSSCPTGFLHTFDVNFDIYASNGLKSFEITFEGSELIPHQETFTGPIVKSRRERNMTIGALIIPPRSGNYILQAKVVDRLGAVATRSIILKADLKRPKIKGVLPHDGETIYNDSSRTDITFEINAVDDLSGIQEVSVVGDTTHNPSWQGTDKKAPYRITIRNVESGEWDWSIRATDRAGNRSEITSVRLLVRPTPMLSPGSR